MVANEPWQKEGTRSVTPAEDRFAMVEAAVPATRPGARRMEIDRGGPSYTVDTVDELHDGIRAAELFVVVGADVVADLPTWRGPSELAASVTLVVVDRPGAGRVEPPPGWRAVSVPVPPFDVSSTELRSRLEAGEPVSGLVPGVVIRCIPAESVRYGQMSVRMTLSEADTAEVDVVPDPLPTPPRPLLAPVLGPDAGLPVVEVPGEPAAVDMPGDPAGGGGPPGPAPGPPEAPAAVAACVVVVPSFWLSPS